jgi:hypothetical protein
MAKNNPVANPSRFRIAACRQTLVGPASQGITVINAKRPRWRGSDVALMSKFWAAYPSAASSTQWDEWRDSLPGLAGMPPIAS